MSRETSNILDSLGSYKFYFKRTNHVEFPRHENKNQELTSVIDCTRDAAK